MMRPPDILLPTFVFLVPLVNDISSSQGTSGSVNKQIPGLKAGDSEAEQWIWDRYFLQVAQAARIQLGTSPQTVHDEEDVAISVFANFMKGVRQDKFKQLNDRNDLHQILVMLTKRKAIDYFRKATRHQKHEVGESALGDVSDRPNTIAEAAVAQPPSELVNEVAQQIRKLFEDVAKTPIVESPDGKVVDLQLGTIALLWMQGLSAVEIGQRIGCSQWTVYRRQELIRRRWREHFPELDT